MSSIVSAPRPGLSHHPAASAICPPESIASLNAAFHSRYQLEGESLAEHSRVLMRIHDRMEQSAASLVESQALALLRDSALKEQFVRGVREQSIRQELRRIVLGSADGLFHDVRNEALCLFQEHDERSRSMRVQPAKVEPARFADGALEACAWETTSGTHDPVVSQMMHTQQQMQTHVVAKRDFTASAVTAESVIKSTLA